MEAWRTKLLGAHLDPLVRVRNQCMLCVYPAVLVCSLVRWGDVANLSGVAKILCICCSLAGLGKALLSKRVAEVDISLYACVICVAIAMQDVYAASLQTTRLWPLFVVVLDLLALCRARTSFRQILSHVLFGWVLLTFIEDVARLGLYDMPGTADDVDRRALQSCSVLPCGRDTLVVLIPFQAGLFAAVHLYLRPHCHLVLQSSWQEEKQFENEKSILRSLIALDLTTAFHVLKHFDSKGDREMGVLFQQLANTMNGFLSYAHGRSDSDCPSSPGSFSGFSGTSPRFSHCSSASPGYACRDSRAAPQTAEVVIVFTDIQSSTALWDGCPDGMKKALRTHNEAMRECIRTYDGYEVKTIGDAFMVAFDDTAAAISCALAFQTSLVNCTWPENLLSLPEMGPHVPGLWHGLRVRIGVHGGPVDVEENPVTGRFDYMGRTVNKAARLESVCAGGAVAVTTELLAKANLEAIDVPFLSFPAGDIVLKGFAEAQCCTMLIPEALKGRSDSVISSFNSGKTFAGEDNLTIPLALPRQRSSKRLLPEFIRVKLHRASSATSGQVGLSYDHLSQLLEPSVYIGRVLNTVIAALDRTDGSVVYLGSTSVNVSWNTQKKCTKHIQQSIRFVTLLQGQTESLGRWKCDPCVGLACGSVLYGGMASETYRCKMMVGSCADVSQALAEHARELQVFCLTASLPNQASAAMDLGLRGFIRPVDQWRLSGLHPDLMVIYQVRTDELANENVQLMGYVDDNNDWGWSEAYIDAFESGAAAVIMQRSADPVLLKVADALLLPKPSRELPAGNNGGGHQSTRRSVDFVVEEVQ
ncbi:Adenylate cyclase [Diplonema papillatum]|nr:Adenylate cyclase [Diplonema papillatum]